METTSDSKNKIYEVKKIINCKFYKNKKYYLIKWLCFPILESTWEPKSSIKHLSSMINKFESEYPYSIDQDMYNIYCTEIKKRKRKRKGKKVSKSKEIRNEIKSLPKTRKIEGFTKSELKDIYYEKLKNHFYIDFVKRHINKEKNQLVIDLSSESTTFSGENLTILISKKENLNEAETAEKNDVNKLIKPILV